MDELESVIVSVSGQVDLGRSENWFQVLTGTYDDVGADWSAFRAALPARADARSFEGSVAESFTAAMDDVSGPADVLRQLSERREQLPDLYRRLLDEERQALAELAAERAEPVAEWDAETGKAWYESLTSDGSVWSGDEAAWDPFVAYFLYRAGEQGVADSAQAFLDNVVLFEDKITGFAAYGVTIAVPVAEDVADEPAAEPLPAAISGEIADQVMAPAIANAVQKMEADGDFSADDIMQVLDEARQRIATGK